MHQLHSIRSTHNTGSSWKRSLQKGEIVIYMIKNLISLLASPVLYVLAKNVWVISKSWLTDVAYSISIYFNVLCTVPKNNQTEAFLVQCSVSVYL